MDEFRVTENKADRRARAFRESYDARHWLTHIFTIQATVFPDIFLRCLFFTAFSSVIYVWHRYAPWELDSAAHEIAGGAIALLIVFRANSAYLRFAEGRQSFGLISARAGDLMRQVLCWVGGSVEAKSRIAHLIIAFPFAVKRRLRLEESTEELRQLWDDPVFLSFLAGKAGKAAENVPQMIAMEIGREITGFRALGWIPSDHVAMAMDAQLTSLQELLFTADKIARTPIPYAYAIEGSRFLAVFLLTLPFSLVPNMGWTAILAEFCLAYAFLGIEQIGVETQQPFENDANDLPLDDLCETHLYHILDIIRRTRESDELKRRHLVESVGHNNLSNNNLGSNNGAGAGFGGGNGGSSHGHGNLASDNYGNGNNGGGMYMNDPIRAAGSLARQGNLSPLPTIGVKPDNSQFYPDNEYNNNNGNHPRGGGERRRMSGNDFSDDGTPSNAPYDTARDGERNNAYENAHDPVRSSPHSPFQRARRDSSALVHDALGVKRRGPDTTAHF